jgi:hypothetical protein
MGRLSKPLPNVSLFVLQHIIFLRDFKLGTICCQRQKKNEGRDRFFFLKKSYSEKFQYFREK